MGKFMDRTGEIHRYLQIIEEIGGNKVMCQCLKCNYTTDYFKNAVLIKRALCKGCGVRRTKLKNRIGEVFRGVKIIEELGNNSVKGKCLECNNIDTQKHTLLH